MPGEGYCLYFLDKYFFDSHTEERKQQRLKRSEVYGLYFKSDGANIKVPTIMFWQVVTTYRLQ